MQLREGTRGAERRQFNVLTASIDEECRAEQLERSGGRPDALTWNRVGEEKQTGSTFAKQNRKKHSYLWISAVFTACCLWLEVAEDLKTLHADFLIA